MKKLKFIPLACMVFMISMLAIGCSNSSSNSEKESEGEAKTRTVKTIKGDVEVPANPKRIVVNFYQGDLLALGVKPIATEKAEGEVAFKNELDDVATIDKWEPEEVMALDPDLLIVTSEEDYEKLNKIAPTILIPFGEFSTEERVTLLGDAVGKQEEAKKVLDNFSNKVEDSKDKLDKAGVMDKTFTLLESHSGKTWIYGNKYGRGGEIFYDYLDLKAPAVIEKEIIDADQYREISLEALPEYCGDYVINSTWGGKDTLSNNDVWNNTTAVKEGRVIKTSAELYFYVDIYSMDVQLDKFVNAILDTTNK
ncbi:ABC transporter substrate-binding protein [Clostridioides mangenotii]|uniref:ABC transporter substrate-binding protein n=1 Tax=Metaclostridioides mangenotii TaxID=1540 RepID=UPI00214A320C|nr:ABC transporter substrate-binding protein [Clostridioides mangenotii]MCR1954427.1 ABC transporter substrate-binding protein [Clostridioides mangenotii]